MQSYATTVRTCISRGGGCTEALSVQRQVFSKSKPPHLLTTHTSQPRNTTIGISLQNCQNMRETHRRVSPTKKFSFVSLSISLSLSFALSLSHAHTHIHSEAASCGTTTEEAPAITPQEELFGL